MDEFLDEPEDLDDVEIVEDEENELHYSVEGLGQFHEIEGQKLFVKTDDCVHCIHDIQVALRKDNAGESRRVDKFLGLWQTVEKRLVPLFLHYREDSKIWSGVLKLLVILTRPLSRGIPETSLHVKFLQDYKEALSTQDLFITLMSILMDAVAVNERTETQIQEIETQILRMEKEPLRIDEVHSSTQETQQVLDERVMELRREDAERRAKKERKRDKDAKRAEIRNLSEQSKNYEKNVELVLTLIRHLLEVPDPKLGDAGFSQSRGQMQIQLIKHLSDEGVLDLLIMFAEQVIEQPKFKNLSWLFFEIFYHICATIPPTELANYDHLFKRDLSRLLDIERKLVFAQVPQYARHSRFATTSVLKGVSGLRSSIAPTVSDGSVTQKAARNRFYRERKVQAGDNPGDSIPNLFQDPCFIDINTSSGTQELLPSSILGKDYKDFYADIKAFIDQFTETVFDPLMESIYSEIQQENKNLTDYDTVRVLNIIAWILDYQGKIIRRNRKSSQSPTVGKMAWALSQNAVDLVTREVKRHSKEAKTIRFGGANLVVALRALLEQLRLSKALGPDSGEAFTLIDSLCYGEVYRMLTWTLRSYKPTANRAEVLKFSLECIDEFLRLIDMFEGKLASSDKAPKPLKKKAPKISQAEAELQGFEFYDQGYSDSDVSVRSSDDEDMDVSFLETLREAKACIMAELAHSEGIKHLFHALSLFKEMSPSTNNAIATILLRITKEKESYVAFFFQLSSLVVLYNIINDPTLRTVEEERVKYEPIILIAKLIIRKFIRVAQQNNLVLVEALFPRAKGSRGGSLFSIESDLNAIFSNYSDEESRIILERIHNGDSYETLKAELKEQAKYSEPWTEEEDHQLMGLWEHVNGASGRSKRDKINMILANVVPLEGKRRRKFKDVKLRLISLGLLDDSADGASDYASSFSDLDDEYRSTGDAIDGASSPRHSSKSESEGEAENNPRNFTDYVKRVNAVKVSEILTSVFDELLALDIGLTEDDHKLLGLVGISAA